MVGVAIVVIACLIFIPTYIILARRRVKRITAANTLIDSCYNGVLKYKERNPNFINAVRTVPFVLKDYKGTPDQLVFRSATVGGVTTGGFSKEGGGYKVKEYKGDRFHFQTAYDGKEIEYIDIPAADLKEAMQSKIGKYIEGGRIKVVHKGELSDTFLALMQLGQTDRALTQKQYEESQWYPTKEMCDEITDWLCGKDD